MDLDLPELLAFLDDGRAGAMPAAVERMFAQIGPVLDRVARAGESKFIDPAARLVWLTAHYMAAPAASHGFQIAYLEGTAPGSLTPYLQDLAPFLPTSTIVNVTRSGQADVQFVQGGGAQSDFEKNDIGFMKQAAGQRNRSGALVVNLNGSIDDRRWIYETISQQVLIAYVCVIRDPGEGQILTTEGSPHWKLTSVRLGSAIVDIYRNHEWDTRIGQLLDLRFKSEWGGAEAYAGGRRVPIVGVGQFPNLGIIGNFPSESIAGPIIHIYSAEEGSVCEYRTGRLGELKTPDRLFLELRNVNVSCADLIWNEQACLFDPSTLSHNFISSRDMKDYRPGGSVPVPEPSRRLEGTYFLCPTVVPHHSHLMIETLRRLEVATRLGGDIKLLVSSLLTPTQRDYFHVFGFDDSRCVYRGVNETVNVERLAFTLESPHKYDRLSLEYFRRIGLGYYDRVHAKNERIYFSRRDARKYRNLVNEVEIEEIFKSFGFEIVMASEITAEQKVDMMSTARYVAGALGAAMLYQAFSVLGEMIILTSDLYFPSNFLETSALQARDVHYIKGLGMKFYNEPWFHEHSSFYVDPEMLRIALQRIVART